MFMVRLLILWQMAFVGAENEGQQMASVKQIKTSANTSEGRTDHDYFLLIRITRLVVNVTLVGGAKTLRSQKLRLSRRERFSLLSPNIERTKESTMVCHFNQYIMLFGSLVSQAVNYLKSEQSIERCPKRLYR
jgi:hypothetical protein